MTEVLASHVSSPQSDGLDWSEGPRLELDQLLAQLVVRAQNVMAAQGRLRGLLVESVMTATVNWLSAMRMFLDHEETDLTRRFGKLSPEFVAFKTATSAAYDSGVGYRFAYQLRNYVQHCGLPLGHVDVRRSGNPLMKQTATLLLNRQVLLNDFDQWKHVKDDLEAMRPTFELLPLLEGAMTGIRGVHRACVEIDLDDALAKVPTLTAALDRLGDVEGEPTLFRHAPHGNDGLRITPHPLQARNGDRPISWRGTDNRGG